MMLPKLHPIALALSLYLPYGGYRKGSLSLSGAIAAFLVGYLSLANDIQAFGDMMLIFYLAGSKATKYKAEVKARLETGHTEATSGGNRDGFQVFCNAFTGVVASVAWRVLYAKDGRTPISLWGWCAVNSGVDHIWSKPLIFAALGHYACCAGDTFASELGILSKSSPVLITTLSKVPAGTNGGVSLRGLLYSLLGGLLMSFTLVLALFIDGAVCFRATAKPHAWIPEVLVVGALAGLGGSLLDSLLGATLQRTWFNETEGKIVTESKPAKGENVSLRVISGIDVLTNSQVNLITGLVVALACAWYAYATANPGTVSIPATFPFPVYH